MTVLRVGVLGLSHDHVWPNLRALAASDVGRLVAVAEPDPALRMHLFEEQGQVEVHAAYDDLLERGDLDAVFVYADNRTSADLARQAIERNLPTMLEKPMAADLAGADALLRATEQHDVPLMVNWPTAWRASIVYGLDLVRQGAIGEPIQVSQRGGHVGPREYGCSPQFCNWLYDSVRNGGGALIDYCGYGALLSLALLGRPSSVTAVAAHLRKENLSAEDNAVVVLRYPRALALLEASWTQIGNQPPYALIVYGDRGTLLVHQPKPAREGETAGPGQVEVVTANDRRTLDPPLLPPDAANGPTYFLTRLRDGRPIEGLCAPALARDVQEVLSAALWASESGRAVTLVTPSA
ncbi:MAG: Gfo/Idh/MocA family oxidoreductase [Chloroflexi bacterium]|nr:Gfo/Idh/MocA family oxidoreductase [Chloroflexota bacterium]